MIAALIRQSGARLICMVKGHKRGKRIEALDNGRTKRYQCPRCSATWDRRGKA